MKPIKLFTIFFTFCAFILPFSSNAQYYIDLVSPEFIVDTPGVIGGLKTFVPANGGATALDPTLNWGRAIDSEWVDFPLAIASDSTGCTTPLASLAGQFALIYRTTCDFSAKAYNAQLAGAVGVVIVNNVAGEINFTMSPGTNATLVTIPVIIIPKATGDSIDAVINSGTTVKVTLTDWGFNLANDLALFGQNALTPYTAIPQSQMAPGNGNPTWYRFYTGAFVANTGINDQTNVTLTANTTFTPTGGSPSTVYQDSVTIPSFPAIDSVATLVSTASHDVNASTTGVFDINYYVHSSVPDDFISNNYATASMYVTTSTFCNSQYDATNDVPITNLAEAPSTGGAFTWGPLFYVANGGYQAISCKLAIDDNDTTPHDISSLSGDEELVLFKWVDANSDFVIQPNELTPVGLSNVIYTTADSDFQFVTSDTFVNISSTSTAQYAYLDSNSYYWVAAVTPSGLFLCVDNQTNYYVRSFAASNQATSPENEFWAPLDENSVTSSYAISSTDSIQMYPFVVASESYNPVDSIGVANTHLVPAISFNIGTDATAAVKNVATSKTTLDVYPNPASDHINVSITDQIVASSITISVMNQVGQILYREKHNNVSTINETISTVSFPPGLYYVISSDGKSAAMKKFTVIK